MPALSKLAVLLWLVFIANIAAAEQRALLVGVGKYAVSGIDLPGIDLDLQRMRDTLNLMGFDNSQIRDLLDDQATSTNVTREFETWLRNGVQADDRVVFYFSGHGSNTPDLNEDEADGVDEVLVTHDVHRVQRNGAAALAGVIDDDSLAELISAIPSRNIWIIVDACHSGTVTRGFKLDDSSLGKDEVFAKSFTYSGMPQGEQIVFDREFSQDGVANFVSMSAAGDGEKAIGTSQGGVFTIGLSKAITEGAKSGTSMTMLELRDKAAAYIRDHVEEARVHNPQVTGNEQLANGKWDIIQLKDGNGPNRSRLLSLVEEQKSSFDLAANKDEFAVGDTLEFTVTAPIDGYLNVVSVDSQDNATVLYPNFYNKNNAVESGRITIPTKEMTFELRAAEPLGSTLVVGFITKEPVNFYNQTLDERDKDGNINAKLVSLSHAMTRGFEVVAKKPEAQASTLAAMREVTLVKKK